ncbi:hypothetical protein ACFVSS_14775 [Peribacillus butanolivorans]|uniref:hypothetical protein n=1 Tax=Peribacillus butanolivorans TaxID=421767 RepID=UPI0036DC24CC
MNWIELKEESDIKDLLERLGYFHDGCLREMHMWTGTYVNEDFSMTVPGELDTNVKMLFQRQYSNPSAIELLFESVTGIHIIPTPENYDSIIRDAIILKSDDNFYWADDYNFQPEKGIENGVSWIAAKKLKGREANDWMGKQNRYGENE